MLSMNRTFFSATVQWIDFPLPWILVSVIFISATFYPNGKMSYPCAVFPEEVDYFVECLRRYQVVDIGSER